MTHLLYQTDSYLHSFEAVITARDEANSSVVLDRTAFYPGGGGQPADQGYLLGQGIKYNVLRVKKIGAEVVHQLDVDHPLPAIGAIVVGELDWDRRYQLMRTHTAMHILCGVVFRDYGALVTGGDMDPLNGRMDFEFETMHKDLVQAIETNINLEVSKGLPVHVKILPRHDAFQIPDLIRTKINLLPEGIQEVRVIEIVGLDLQADGGTHVKSTDEVGRLRIVDYKSKGKINKRIYLALEPL
jgi:misacylated tRNA(Ala) deacylase